MTVKRTSLMLLCLFSISVTAQDGKSLMKSAKKAFTIFKLDNGNTAKLIEATNDIDKAVMDAGINGEADVWLLQGDVYNEIATQAITIRQLGIGDASKLPKRKYPSLTAFEAHSKASDLAQKKYETKDALKGIRIAQGNLSNEGVYAYDGGDYKGSYNLFNSVIEAHTKLKSAGEESILDRAEDFNDQAYITGLAALNAGLNKEALQHFDALYQKKYEKAVIYEALYNIAALEEDPAQAYRYLEEGRKLFPDDVGLLFAEINHFLRTNQLDKLVTKLETAIDKEPDNVSLYNTLGNVYDNLYQRESQGGDPDLINLYFNNALNYYQQAQTKDPNNAVSAYSIGALYFNKAAIETQVLMQLGDDFSSEGLKKYEKKKAEIMEIFELALPHLKRSESLNPNDVNTLIALKEIYARKDDLAMSNIFKDRLETVQNGGSNSSSYFSN